MSKPYKNLSGQKFGKLLVIEYDDAYTQTKQDGKLYWKCQGERGNIVYVATAQLNNGRKTSCGCATKAARAKNMRERVQSLGAQSRLIDLTGKSFGNLTVIGRDTLNSKENKPLWICKCSCGNIISVRGQSLRDGATHSCGCLGRSIGEHLIEEILKNLNVDFKREISFEDLRDEEKLRYDFGIYRDRNLSKLIEYDGRQHSDITSLWFSPKVMHHDKLKTEYANAHHIPLLRIDYSIDKRKIPDIIKEFLGIAD